MKTDRLYIRVTETQKEDLKEKADALGQKLSDYVRSKVLGKDAATNVIGGILNLRMAYINEKKECTDIDKINKIQEQIEGLDKVIINLTHMLNDENLEF